MDVSWSAPAASSGHFRLLNVSQLLRAKLWAWNRRGGQKFDRDDIMWLLRNFGDDIDPSAINLDIAADFADECESAEEAEWVRQKLGLV